VSKILDKGLVEEYTKSPATSTDTAIARFDGTDGRQSKDSPDTTLSDSGRIYSGDGTASVNGANPGPELFMSRNDDANRQFALSNGTNEMFMFLQPGSLPATFGTATDTDLAVQVNNSIFVMGVRGDTGEMSIGGFFGAGGQHDPSVSALTVSGASGQTAPIQKWDSTYGNTVASIDPSGQINTAAGVYAAGFVGGSGSTLYIDGIRTSFPGDTASINVASRQLQDAANGFISVDWNARTLNATDQSDVVDFSAPGGPSFPAVTANSIVGLNGSNTVTPFQWIKETPSGAVNGSNVNFTLAETPQSSGAVSLYLDGLYLHPTEDYSISGTAITMTTAPTTGQKLRASYLGEF
jgi:hypothetical protein